MEKLSYYLANVGMLLMALGMVLLFIGSMAYIAAEWTLLIKIGLAVGLSGVASTFLGMGTASA